MSANKNIKKFIILFAFNLCTQIKIFTKYIFTNKQITVHYYIYRRSRCLRLLWLVVDASGWSWMPPAACGCSWLVVGIRWHICKRHPGGHATQLLSAAAVSLPNQGFGVKFRDAITLIINYLSNPLGRAFVECFIG